jgi:2-polyprenyl-3-methyl-5-hydroxy-6-metoxy-1,4-benzoquinol methylase
MNNIWEKPNCNLCGQGAYKVIWNGIETWIAKGKYRLVSCNGCNLVYLSPRPKKAFILRYYPPETYWGIDVTTSKGDRELTRQDKAYGYLYRQIFKRKKKGHILDVGTGTGLFLLKFKKLGWKTDGVELSGKACEYAKKAYGLKIIKGGFPEVKLSRTKYDVITFNGCLEHLYEPKESLERAYKLLKKNGVIEITVPNFESLGRLIFGKRWYALQPPSHLYHFSPITITKALQIAGFRNIKIMHNYWSQNKYILFESIRLAFSPRFQGKILALTVSFLLATIEPVIKKGEVITIYAKK